MNKEQILYNILLFLGSFVIIFVIIYLFNQSRLKGKKKTNIGEITYLINKFKLDTKKLNAKKMIKVISIIDSFIISFVGTFIVLLPISFLFQLLVGFVMLFALTYALFELYGRSLVHKQKEEK